MRFNSRACALMDIPDLPAGAFEHIGDRKIKLQGGTSPDVVSAINNAGGRIPDNFSGDIQYFNSPEYQQFLQSSADQNETADLAYTSPYFGSGLSSSSGARQDQAYQDYLNRTQVVPQRRPSSMTPAPDVFPAGTAGGAFADLSNTMTQEQVNAINRQSEINQNAIANKEPKNLQTNFIGSTLNIPNVGAATVTGLTQFTNTPGFSISTDKGNYVYYDTSYVNQGLLNEGQQYISPGLLPYIQRKEAVEVDLSSYQDAFKTTKKGIPISGNGYLFTNPEADNVAPWIFGITEDIRPLNNITADASGNLSYVGSGPYRNGSYNSYLQTVDGGLLRLQTDTNYKTGGGGGILGGIGNFISGGLNSVSNLLGTSGSGGGVLGGLAKIDPGPAIGSGLADVDKFVNREIPGGYVLPAALALAAATGYVDPSLFATQAAGTAAGGAAAGTAAGTGLSAAELLAVGGFAPTAGSTASFAAPSLLGSAALTSGLSAPELLAVGGFAPSAGSGASFVVPGLVEGTGLLSGYTGATKGLLLPEMISGTVGSLSGAGSASGIAGTQAAAGLGVASGSALPAAGMAVGALPSTVGQFSAALPAQGSVGGAGALSSQLAPGTILGSGLQGGGAIGGSYALGANGLPATGLLGQPIPASSIGISNIPETVTAGTSLSSKDIIDAARIGSKLLGGAQPQQQAQQTGVPQSIVPRGQVNYSGLLNLLSPQMAQRNNSYSLLG